MADNNERRNPEQDNPGDRHPEATGAPGIASEPVEDRGTVLSEGGRALDIDPSPEGSMMRMGTVTTSEPAPLPPDMDREATFEEIDDRAADEARMAVRRREHSAD